MNMKSKVRKVTPRDRAKIKEAQKGLDAILEEVKPFIKKRPTLYPSTSGQWKVLSYE